MPLASLRPRSSFRDLLNGPATNHDSSTDAADPVEGSEGTHHARPQSARSHLRTSMRPASGYSNAPVLGSRPMTERGFSFKKSRHASDPQLSTRFYDDASVSGDSTPPGAPAPIIGITAPTWRPSMERTKRRFNPFTPKAESFRSKSQNLVPLYTSSGAPSSTNRSPFKSLKTTNANSSVDHSPTNSGRASQGAPSVHGDTNQSLSIPVSRVSASSISEQESARPSLNVSQSEPRTATKSSTTSKFFRLPRKTKKSKKGDDLLFPLPVQLSPSNPNVSDPIPQPPTIIPVQHDSAQDSHSNSTPPSPSPILPGKPKSISNLTPPTSPPPTNGIPAASTGSLDIVPPRLVRQGSTTSAPAARSSSLANQPLEKPTRGRSGTTTSFSSRWEDERSPTPLRESGGRNSMASTTIGRNSVAGLRNFTARWRHPSDSQSPTVNSPGDFGSSKNNSFALSKDTLVVPDREEGETAGKYYARLEADLPKKSIALTLSKSTDPFHQDVLRSLMRTFKFYEEPMDISLRKFLWEIDLPGEAQQIDRVMSAFAERYHECNPHIFNALDQAYLAAYSLIILHSDLFNKNNKRKMQRSEYQKNTGGHGIDEEILGYFYDNIQYTEFIAQNPDDDESEMRSKKSKARKRVKKIKIANAEGAEKGKLDPYDFIIDDKLHLEVLRPALKGVMNLDDTFHYMGTSPALDIRKNRLAFAHPGILQVISARSRPEAFTSPSTIENPLEAHPGIVEIKVAKVGVIWRKDAKKKKTRSPWQKWGALLTQSQFYFFRNVAWVEELMKQSESNQKHTPKRSVVFKPPIEEFKPDLSLRTLSAVALVDSTYDKHKHGFVLASYDGFSDETVLADSENEMNDWLAKINYCAAFTCANIAMQPISSPEKDPLLKVETSTSSNSTQTSLAPEDALEHPMARQINTARREAIKNKIVAADNELPVLNKKLEESLKTARHLQILAPFPPKTRSDLLSFGVRMAHRIRWSRFDIWRLKCHREMLAACLETELKPDKSSAETEGLQAKSPKPLSKVNALSRLNSKASAIIHPQKNYRSAQSRHSVSTKPGSTQEAELAKNMDKAFATPAETITKSESKAETPFKLPPLALGSGSISVSSYEEVETAESDYHFRQNSTASEASQLKFSEISQLTEQAEPQTPTVAGQDEQKFPEQRPSTAAGSDKEQAFGNSTTPRNSNVRRSLQRTLRDSREYPVSQKHRRHKDSVSTLAVEDNPTQQDNDILIRGTGSFKVHGKKASVITFGSEWQNMSAEERLRARKQALSQESSAGASSALEGDVDDLSQQEDENKAAEEMDQLSSPASDGNGVIIADRLAVPVNVETASQVSSNDAPLEQSAVSNGVEIAHDEHSDASSDSERVSIRDEAELDAEHQTTSSDNDSVH